MKEAFIAFVIALVAGSIFNGMKAPDDSASTSQSSSAQEEVLNRTTYVDESNFESEVIDSRTPVLVDFYSDTCGPCKKMEPVLAEVADEYQGSLKVARIDVLRTPHLAAKYSISAVPVLMVFKEGKCEQTVTGGQGKSQLVSMIKPYLDAETSAEVPAKPSTLN